MSKWLLDMLRNIFLATILAAISYGILTLCHQQMHFWSFNAGILVLGTLMMLRDGKKL